MKLNILIVEPFYTGSHQSWAEGYAQISNHNVKIITIGKTMWSSGVGMWTDTSLPVLVDPSPYPVWEEWGAEIRDLYFVDAEGNHYTHYNITMTQNTPEATEEVVMNQIQNTINNMLFGLNIESEPLEYSMLHAYPNPFNPIINIAFSMDVGSYPNMTIFDLKGTPIEIFPTAYYKVCCIPRELED